MSTSTKPLGRKAYGSIPHLPESRLGPGDHKIDEGRANILTCKARDPRDRIIVQEKVDGSNVAVARVGGKLYPLSRAGHVATTSPYEQHHLFAHWVRSRPERFAFLRDGERICGEWLAMAHGTRYENVTEETAFVAFDLMRGVERALFDEFRARVSGTLTTSALLHDANEPLPLEVALSRLGTYGHHGALDPAEGVVYRCERNDQVEFLAKFVRHDKVAGKYFPQFNDGTTVWNWRPTPAPA